MSHKCIEKRRAYNREYYARTPERKAQIIKAVKARQTVIKNKLKAYKATLACVMCGEDDPITFEFHHVDPRTKDGNPADLVQTKGWSFERIVDHLEATCLCLCANCHRRIHAKLRESAKPKPAKKKIKKK